MGVTTYCNAPTVLGNVSLLMHKCIFCNSLLWSTRRRGSLSNVCTWMCVCTHTHTPYTRSHIDAHTHNYTHIYLHKDTLSLPFIHWLSLAVYWFFDHTRTYARWPFSAYLHYHSSRSYICASVCVPARALACDCVCLIVWLSVIVCVCVCVCVSVCACGRER